MKKLKLSVLAVLTIFVVSSVFYSCSNEKLENNEIENRITAKQMEFVGIEHNEMLNESFNFLKENKKKLKNNTRKVNRKLLEEFFISKVKKNDKYSNESNEIGIQSLKNFFSNSNINNRQIMNRTTEEDYYLNRIDFILTDSTNTENQITAKINTIEEEIQNDLSLTNEDLMILFSATQTAKYSYSYWISNLEQWSELDDNENRLFLRTEDDGHNGCACGTVSFIAKADVVGAVGGATYALAVNLIPGAGQVAYGSAIVATAASASAMAAASEFLDWLGW